MRFSVASSACRVFACILFSALFLTRTSSVRADSVLIVGADDPTRFPVAELQARGFTTVSTFDSTSGTPTLAQLNNYDAVLNFTNGFPNNPSGLGNVLADYVDAGGRLALSTYSFSTPWEITGRIATAGYSPLLDAGVNGDVSGALVRVAPGDPIFNGVGAVSYFHNINFAHPGLAAGATLLATDGSGNIMLARNAAGNIVGMNLFPEINFGNNAAFYDLLANALRPSAPLAPSAAPVPAAVWAGMALFGMMGGMQLFRRRWVASLG